MKYVVFDTETNGLFNFKEPADAPGQPRLAHLAMIMVDEALEEESRTDIYVRPDGWTMPQGPGSAGAVNGLTDHFLQTVGVPIADALDVYADEILAGRVMVAFNAQYDLKVMRGEFRRLGRPDLFEQTLNVCVMRPCTGICRIPYPNRGGLKFPSLTEALDHFKVKPSQFKAHGAVDDAHGALLIMRQLHRLGLLPTPAIHYAKEKSDAPPKPARSPARRPARRQATTMPPGGLF